MSLSANQDGSVFAKEREEQCWLLVKLHVALSVLADKEDTRIPMRSAAETKTISCPLSFHVNLTKCDVP